MELSRCSSSIDTQSAVGFAKSPQECRNGDEPAAECARRELREEAGLVATRWDRLEIVTIPSFCDERIDLFLARDLAAAPRELDHDEVIVVERVKFDDALAMVRSGEIIDAKTIVALHHAQAMLRDGDLRVTNS